MAEERNLGLARAPESAADTDAADATKAELQRRMDEARESISQTVTEIKETVVNQYQQVRETISDTLDWREQYRRHTLPITVGAFAVGALVGYGVMGVFKSDGDGYDDDEDDAFDRIERGFDRMGPARSYAGAPILGEHQTAAAYQRASASESSAEGEEAFGESRGGAGSRDRGPDARPSYSSGYQAATAPPRAAAQSAGAGEAREEEEEPKGPGLFERFKETKAYDKLTDELSTLGERVVEELSRTAQTVVVPLLLNKIKGLIGVDLSGRREGQQRGLAGQQTAPKTAGGTGGGSEGIS
ncbi:MAG: hypothetical protein DMF67_15485 [Acidobacteria bacterium]|nr:MAG: hypothetical protein DMF67_15485 [Acidobacteriota bacterium]